MFVLTSSECLIFFLVIFFSPPGVTLSPFSLLRCFTHHNQEGSCQLVSTLMSLSLPDSVNCHENTAAILPFLHYFPPEIAARTSRYFHHILSSFQHLIFILLSPSSSSSQKCPSSPAVAHLREVCEPHGEFSSEDTSSHQLCMG